MATDLKPFISLVIPTRERVETLKYTIQTALNQAKENYEIIISDNFSQDNTKEVVESFSDPRIKYINTGKRLSMCDNWDFALEYVSGDYVIFIGDDDGVMPGAIDKLQRLIQKDPNQIYFWRPHEYCWPIDNGKPVVSFLSPIIKPYKMNLKKLAKFSINWGGWRYGALPLLYHSVVPKEILDQIKRKTGRVFHSTNPDIFMAYALPTFKNSSINTGESFTVNARSQKSNGASSIAKEGANTLKKFVEECGNYRVHRSLYPDSPFFMNSMADSALVAMELFPEYYDKITFNYSAMWAYIWGISKFEKILNIIKIRNKVRKFHPFSVTKFLVCSLIHSFFGLRRKILRKRLKNLTVTIPNNIKDYVNWLSHAIPSQQD